MDDDKLFSTTIFRLRRLLRQIWVRTSAFAVLAFVTALVSRVIGPILPDAVVKAIDPEAVLSILTVLSSSMLAVTTFSLGVIVSSRQAITSNATPRAHRIVADNPVTQGVLSTFMAAFVYALTAQVLIRTGLYEARSAAVILIVSLFVLLLVVIAILRWIDHLSALGSIPDTVKEIETAAAPAIRAWHRQTALGGRPRDRDSPPPGTATNVVRAPSSGYVQYVDVGQLDTLAEKAGEAEIHVAASSGMFVVKGAALCHYSGDLDAEKIANAFTIAMTRTFDQDARFGIGVLSEIAQRALSPAMNDPGTAIFIIGRIEHLLAGDPDAKPRKAGACTHVFVPEITAEDLVADGFSAIARDGAAMVEVQARLQDAFATLAGSGRHDMVMAAQQASKRALALSDASLTLEIDREAVRRRAERVHRTG